MLAWFFRGSGPVLLKNLYFCDFSGGSRPPDPPLDPPMAVLAIKLLTNMIKEKRSGSVPGIMLELISMSWVHQEITRHD